MTTSGVALFALAAVLFLAEPVASQIYEQASYGQGVYAQYQKTHDCTCSSAIGHHCFHYTTLLIFFCTRRFDCKPMHTAQTNKNG